MTEEELEQEFFNKISSADHESELDPMVLFGAIALSYYVASRMAQQNAEVGADSFKGAGE